MRFLNPGRPHALRLLAFAGAMALLAAPLTARDAEQLQAGADSKVELATKRALLIGINDYAGNAFADLRGAVNDVVRMRELLIQQMGYEESNITVLTDGAATRDRILEALRRVVSESREGDALYVHYSGHGSQVEDLSGDESDDDGKDETLVPHDGRTEGVADIVDDEIDAILSQLRTENVVVVLDCCHSGTGTRGLVQYRTVAPDTRLSLYGHVAVRPRGVATLAQSKYVLFAGADKSQSALDGPVDGKIFGFFTHSFCKAIANSDASDTPLTVLERVVAEYRRLQDQLGLYSMPEPQLEGMSGRLRAPLFPERRGARLPWALVRTIEGPREVLLVGATRLGASVGSDWSLYPAGTTSFEPGRAVAWGRVTGTEGDNARLRLNRKQKGVSLDGARAVAVLPPNLAAKQPVAVRAASGEAIRAAVTKIEGEVALVSEERANFHVVKRGSRYRVLGADGISEVATCSAKELSEQLPAIVRRSVDSAGLLALDNHSSGIALRASVARRADLDFDEPRTRGIRVVGRTRPVPYRFRRPGSPRTLQNSLIVKIEADLDVYVTIAHVDPEGHVGLLFPNDAQSHAFHPDGFVPAGQTTLIPDSLDDDNRAGFSFDYSEPAGTDTIRVFASTDIATAELIRSSIRAGGVGRRGGTGPSPIASLRSQLLDIAARGIVIVANTPPDTDAPVGSDPESDFGVNDDMFEDYAEFEPDLGPDSFTPEPGAPRRPTSVRDWTATTITIEVQP